MKCYVSKSDINCGPCAFINLIGLKGNKNLENKLSSTGRLKPFFANDYTSFLIWTNKYKKNIDVYIMYKKIDKKFEDLMCRFEKIPKNKSKVYRRELKTRHDMLNKKFADKITIIKNPMKKLDLLLADGYLVAVLISDYYLHEDKNVPHWIVAYKKRSGKYSFMDSARGIITLTRKEVLKGFRLNKKNGIYPELVSYRCKKC